MAFNRNISVITVMILVLASTTSAAECESKYGGKCRDKEKALKLKLVAIMSILVTSMIGVCLPIFSREVPALQPDRDLFVLVKAFASGVILATGYMHVLPDSFQDLTSQCLPQRPWHTFPFTTFIAMLSAVLTLSIDSLSISYFNKTLAPPPVTPSLEAPANKHEIQPFAHHHDHAHGFPHDHAHAPAPAAVNAQQLLRYRVVAQVLELGIVVHSVVIGLSMGASDNPCTIRPLIAALCFHQMFEGMGLGGCILQAEYGMKVKAIMIFFFSVTTPFGIALGIGVSKVYSDTSPTALIVEGVLNAVSAGLLNYMALVELLASDFMGPRLQSRMKLQALAYFAVLLGAGGMAVMAIWA
ncbi:hypothetical protein Fmac_003064 [Flemingia macrophylla]|uniref:Fe(2+) transport protein 1 n=1 Tax=Flemingia macrophylla TaxID=520843 RepID=A0ABD1NLQ6_9FABA